MSYSFNAKGPSKTEAILDAEAKFDKVVADMPIHAKDKDLVLAHLRAVVAVVAEPRDTEDVYIAMNGYMIAVSPADTYGAARVTTVAAGCSVTLGNRT